MSSADPRELRDAGMSALQAGDAAAARRHFEAIVAAGQANPSIWGALAMACQRLGDLPAMHAAADKALELDQANIPALILKGDAVLASGDARVATSFYGLAAVLAARAGQLPASLQEMVRRAEAARDRINADIERHLRAELARQGYDETRSSGRFTHSLDLVSGRRHRYFQQPRAYYYPDLPDTQFYPRARFPWLESVEAATDEICAELAAVVQRGDTFAPYIRSGGAGPANRTHRLLDSPDWSAHFLWKDGAPVAGNAERCPKTLAALAAVPLARIPRRTPSILFSQLRPGAHIAPHTGFLNCRLICHLPLIVPVGCRLRVGNETREWRRGVAWVFNDSIEHEAWNGSSETRIVLIFDIWHPDLDDEERRLVSALLQAVDSYGGKPAPQWDT